ncbi:MAG: Hsp70 family protein, partial [Desulfobacter sp.]
MGHEGVKQYIDNGAEGRYMQSIKSFLSDLSFQKTNVYGKNYTLEALIGHLLKTMKDRGENIIGRDVDKVVLGRPVIFSTDREQDILSVGGLYIGGDNFDSLIMRHKVAKHYGTDVKVKSKFSDNLTGLSPLVLNHLMQWHRIPWLRRPQTLGNIKELKVCAGLRDRRLLENLERLIRDNYGYLLFRSIESAKCRLSDHGDATVIFKDYGIVIEELVTRIAFEDMIQDLVAQIDACVTDTLANAGIGFEQVNAV